MIWYILALTILSMLPSTSGNRSMPTIISRINYGTVFERTADMYMGAEHWTHTFILTLEKPVDLNPLLNLKPCNFCLNKSNDYHYVIHQLDKLHNRTLKNINTIISNIFTLVQEHNNHTVTSRKRRSLLPIIADIGQTLFGFATTKQINGLKNAMNKIINSQNREIKGFEHEIDIMHSFMTTTDDRLNNIVKGLKENNMIINELNTKLQSEYKNLHEKTSIIMSLLIDQIYKSSELTNSYSKLMNGISNLLQKKLTTDILPYSILKSTILNIQNILKDKRPGFHLMFKDPHFYFRHDHFFFHRQGNKIMITLKFPIGSLHKPLTLYKVKNFPVPLNVTSKHATSISDLPAYLAVTIDQNYYLEISKEQLDNCKTYNKIIYCNVNAALIHSTFTKCVLALFKDDRNTIKTTCNFKFMPNRLTSSLEQLNQTHFLAYNISKLTLHCDNVSTIIEGCTFCILKLPCNCEVTTKQYYLPQRWNGCHNDSTTISKLHPVNLALLQEYFTETELKNVSSDTTFNTPINVTTPPFKIFNHGISDIIANDKNSHMNLQKMINMSKQNKLIFTSLADSMYSESLYINDTFPTELILAIIGTSLAASALILCIFLLRRYNFLITVLVINELLPKANAFTKPPSFHYTWPTQETVTAPPYNVSISDIADITNIVLAKILLTFIIIFCIWFCLRNKSKSILMLDITDGNNCIQIPVQHLPHNIASCHFQGSAVLAKISISFGIFSKLIIDWGDLSLRNTLLRNEVPLKSIISINPIMAFKTKAIVENKFSMFIWVNHNNVSVPIHVCTSVCTDCRPAHAISSGTLATDTLLDDTV